MLRYYFFPVPRYATNLITISILFFGFASVIQLLPRERSDLFGKEGGLPGAQENDTKWYHKQNVYSLKKNGRIRKDLTIPTKLILTPEGSFSKSAIRKKKVNLSKRKMKTKEK
jgi:hypothetical protein